MGVNNWLLDTCLAAHVLDNRREISGIKFQAFVLLGVDEWDTRVKPYFKSGGTNVINRIKDVRLHDLLMYNSLDSLFEWKVAKIQARQLGIEWR